MTRRLLVVSPAFPPHPSPATHRARFLARYAEEAGWSVDVLAVHPTYYDEALDTELLRLLPDGLHVEYAPALPSTWTRRLGFTDLALRSYYPMLRALRRICRERKPEALFIPGGPFYTFRLGARVRAEFGIPYVLDFTDPWVFRLTPAQNGVLKKAYWARQLAVMLEPRAVRNAAHIVAVSGGTNDDIRARYPDLPARRFSAMPFGFEAADFAVLREHPRPNPHWSARDGNFHFVYVGAMLPHGYETLRALFRGALRLRETHPALASRLRLHFFGTTYDPRAERGLVLPVAQEMGLGAVVTEHPRRVPYLDALNLLLSADGVLALGSTERHYTASKIFPCILAQRPLLAMFHAESTVCAILRSSGVGELVTYDDDVRPEARVETIAGALERIVSGSSAHGVRSTTGLEEYSARRMSLAIFRVLDSVVDEYSGAGRQAQSALAATPA